MAGEERRSRLSSGFRRVAILIAVSAATFAALQIDSGPSESDRETSNDRLVQLSKSRRHYSLRIPATENEGVLASTITLRNTTGLPLKLRGSRKSCACLGLEPVLDPLPPGRETEVEVRVSLSPGEKAPIASVDVADPAGGRPFQLMIELIHQAGLVALDRGVTLPAGSSAEIGFRQLSGEYVRLTDVRPDPDLELDAEVRQPEGSRPRILITNRRPRTGPAVVSSVRGEIVVDYLGPSGRGSTSVPVIVRSAGWLEPAVQRLGFGILSAGRQSYEQHAFTVDVTALGAEQVPAIRWSSSGGRALVRLHRRGPDRLEGYVLVDRAAKGNSGFGTDEITLLMGDTPVWRCPVSFRDRSG